METPKNSHWKVGKIILRYIVGTINFGIMYSTKNYGSQVGYTHIDFAGSIDDRKSTSSYAFHLGSCLISWETKNHPIVTISSSKVQYVATTSTTYHVVWLWRILEDLQHKQKEKAHIFCENNSAIELSKILVLHYKRKHIDTIYHFIIEIIRNGETCLQIFKSQDKLVDIFTKEINL